MKPHTLQTLFAAASFAAFLTPVAAPRAAAQTVAPIDRIFTHYTTAWIANDGGIQSTHVPHDMLNMFVRDDGTVATVCNWDEGGSNVAVFRDGRLISVPEGSGTGGWGRFSMTSVVMDGRYVYQLLSQHGCDGANDRMNENGLPQFPPCNDSVEWKVIRRYDIETGLAAPFPAGYGYKGDMALVTDRRDRTLAGLAITDSELFVAVTPSEGMRDSVKVFDKRTMRPVRQFAVEACGQMAADPKGGVWILHGRSVVRLSQRNGRELLRFELPADVEAASVAIDMHRHRLLIPNSGRNLDVLIYDNIYRSPRLAARFGTPGGIFSETDGHLRGEAGPMRFCGPCGAGVDTNGNIYVANTFVGGGRGAVIESYDERSGRRNWKSEGLIFTATADFDRHDMHRIFSPEKIHTVIDPDRSGRLDTLTAYTLDPFLFPDDMRAKPSGVFVTAAFKRRASGCDLLFISDMYGGALAGYRFDPKEYGYVGIPFLTALNGTDERPISFWVDSDGDAAKQPDEVRQIREANPYSMSFFVDHACNIWRGTRQQGFMLWRLKGAENGIPQYADGKLYPLPRGTNGAKRIWYDPVRDELFIAGFSDASPDAQDTWWCMGSTIARYDRVMERLDAGTWDGDVEPDMTLYLPFNIEDGSGRDHHNAKSFTVEGDYIFVALARYGYITVYDRRDGHFVGRLQPGPEVGGQSGWCDFNYAINAMRCEDGSYRILIEENAFAKVLMYTVRDFETEVSAPQP